MKIFIKKILGRYSHVKKDISCECRWYGTEYGGFYVIPSLIEKDSIIYSFGIGTDISFDKDLIDRFNCKIYGFDPTPKSIEWCNEQTLPKKFIFSPFGIAEKTSVVSFNLPKNKHHVSGSIIKHQAVSTTLSVDVQMKSFEDIVKKFNHKKVDVVKMDIEGAEYDVIKSIMDSNIIINQIVFECHERFFKDGKKRTMKVLDCLRKNGFLLYATSKNYEELSFVNRNLI